MINKKTKGFFPTIAMACMIAAPVIAADNNDQDHRRRAEEVKEQKAALKTENVGSYNGSIPTGSNPFQYLPTDIHQDIFEKAAEKSSQTAKNLTSTDKYSNDLMYMNGEKNLAHQARQDWEIAKSISVVTDGEGYIEIFSIGNTVNNRVLQNLCEMHPHLKNLTIQDNKKITDLTPILMLHNLESLELVCKGVTVIPNLAVLHKLTVVALVNCIGIQDLSFLNALNLDTLGLSGCTGITNLESLLHCNISREICLDGCTGITDLTPLEKQINLKELILRDTGISEEKVIALSRALPHCAIKCGKV
ncbi:MAG: hypothetical protein K2X98_01875 [Alphaproteobacteria bacterium]|nr:hypothetical protein [Alphaproteobacteria bacterium]